MRLAPCLVGGLETRRQRIGILLLNPQVGGLGDVVTGLARACLQRGHHVEVVLPFYECLPEERIEGLRHERDFDVPKVRRAAAAPPIILLRTTPSGKPRSWQGSSRECGTSLAACQRVTAERGNQRKFML